MKCSIVLTVHDEGLIVQPTLAAMLASVRFLEARGGEAELIAVADRANDVTLSVVGGFVNAQYFPGKLIETKFGEPGPARNVGVQNAAHDWIAIHDGDEMVCENWFHVTLRLLNEMPKAIAHSHWSVVFGREGLMWGHPKEDSPIYEWRDFEISNPWSVQCVAAKSAFLEVPYRAYRQDKTFEFEDWYWNAEVEKAGYRHVRVQNTVHAVRRKEISRDLIAKTNRKILEPLPPRKTLPAAVLEAEPAGAPPAPGA